MKAIEITDTSDVSPPPPGIVQAVTPRVVISLMTFVIHMAAVKYIFLSI